MNHSTSALTSTSTFLDVLPFDALEPIMDLLTRSDIARLARTCKRASNDPRIIGKLYKDLRNTVALAMPPMSLLKKHGCFVRGLKIDLGNPTVLEQLADVDGALALTNLRKLVVKLPEYEEAMGTGPILSAFLKNLPNPSRVFSVSLQITKGLYMYGGPIRFQMFSGCFDVFTNIQQLSGLYPNSLNLFLPSSDTIRKLRISSSRFVDSCHFSEAEFKRLWANTRALKQMQNVEYLQLDRLTYTPMFDFFVQNLSPAIKEIGVGGIFDADGDDMFTEKQEASAIGALRRVLPKAVKLEFRKDYSLNTLWDFERGDHADMPQMC
ncbi:hypothetical protein HDU97_010362 [Phlyctochytrium planicorne]|nr:hypothetical protein HDU97_010362 [Phlyctochytrium planicorne]